MSDWMSDLKLYLLNAGSLAVSFSTVEMTLKIMLLLVSLGYTLYKWNLLRKKQNED
jgi:hypothetical protein